MARRQSVKIPDISGPASREQTETKRRDVTNCVPGIEKHVTKSTQLQPIRKPQKTKLPPLKETLLPETCSRLPSISQQPKRYSSVRDYDRTPEVVPSRNESRHQRNETWRHDDRTDSEDEKDEENIDRISPSHREYDQSKPIYRNANTPERHSTCHGPGVDIGSKHHAIKWNNAEDKPAWFEEREKLRHYKKKAEPKQRTLLKPLKATQTFTEKMVSKQDSSIPSRPEKPDRNIGTGRRSCLDRPLDRATPFNMDDTTGYPDSRRACALGPITPRGTECGKKGVGFRSKSRLAELRLQEEKRIEKARKERERLEARIPKSIRKDFKKYGFSNK